MIVEGHAQRSRPHRRPAAVRLWLFVSSCSSLVVRLRRRTGRRPAPGTDFALRLRFRGRGVHRCALDPLPRHAREIGQAAQASRRRAGVGAAASGRSSSMRMSRDQQRGTQSGPIARKSAGVGEGAGCTRVGGFEDVRVVVAVEVLDGEGDLGSVTRRRVAHVVATLLPCAGSRCRVPRASVAPTRGANFPARGRDPEPQTAGTGRCTNASREWSQSWASRYCRRFRESSAPSPSVTSRLRSFTAP